MTEWVAWVEIPDRSQRSPAERVRYYVTHGVPFLQLTPFRTEASRYSSESVARRVAEMAAGAESPRGVEQLPRRLTR